MPLEIQLFNLFAVKVETKQMVRSSDSKAGSGLKSHFCFALAA